VCVALAIFRNIFSRERFLRWAHEAKITRINPGVVPTRSPSELGPVDWCAREHGTASELADGEARSLMPMPVEQDFLA